MSQDGIGSLMRPQRSQSWVSSIENAQRFTDAATLRELARVLDTTVADLLGEPPLPGYREEWAMLSASERERFNRALGYLLTEFGATADEAGEPEEERPA